MRTAQSQPSDNAKLAPFRDFFGRNSHREQIPQRHASIAPEQGEPAPLSVAMGFWLVMFAVGIPMALGYIGIIRWLWKIL